MISDKTLLPPIRNSIDERGNTFRAVSEYDCLTISDWQMPVEYLYLCIAK